MSDPEMTTFGMYPEPEPVAWFCKLPDNKISIKIVGKPTEGNWEPLYTAPPSEPVACKTCESLARAVMMDQTSHDTKKEWQGLTDEDIQGIHYQIKTKGMGAYSTEDIYRAIEAKLREKNET